MFKKIKNFLKKDIRWKLIRISELTKLKFLYPKQFKLNGFFGFYTKLIIRLIALFSAINQQQQVQIQLLLQ